ncbi:MAG: alpha/beta hydrolase [Kofleriaceae bacterium]|nr:alpha/beta hydrolase [Kofleriaceae bacterium]
MIPALAFAKPRWQELPLPPAMPAPAASGFVEVNGAKIYYALHGTADTKREPVILLHGGLGNSDHFAFQLPALVAKFQVIVVDSRGQGRSTLSKAKLTYHAMAEDVLAVMDTLGVARAHLAGWSDGGALALDLAVHHPDRVGRVFVIGTNYDAKGNKPRTKTAPTFAKYAAKCRKDHAKLTRKPKTFDAAIDALLPIWRAPAAFTKQQLRSIKAPTLVTLGDHDEIIAMEQVEEMATLIPNAKLAVFADTSHFAMWQDPTSINQTLVEFLSGVAP